jgi:hypothetical protein
MVEHDPKSSRTRSLTRLVIGGFEIGADELMRRLLIWERDAAQAMAKSQDSPGSQTLPDAENAQASSPSGIEPAVTQVQAQRNHEQARLALIGLVFEMQDNLRHSLTLLGKMENLAGRFLDPFLKPLRTHRLFDPARSEINRLVDRGETEIARWVARGRQEDAHSRVLAEMAFDDVVDTYIEYLAANPEVQDLVQSQSTGLANEVIEEVRERTVSADTFLEGVARSLLRRVPRRALPEPPNSVRQHAASLRPEKKTRPPSR